MLFLWGLLCFSIACNGMESNDTDFKSNYSMYEKKYIAKYIEASFNIKTPEKLDVFSLLHVFTSDNLSGNLGAIINLIETQVVQKDLPNYYDALKGNEEQVKYIVMLEWIKKSLPLCIESIKKNCTIPINLQTQERLLEEFWYSYWGLTLPSNVRQKNFDDLHVNIIPRFVEACVGAKKLFYDDKQNLKEFIISLQNKSLSSLEEVQKTSPDNSKFLAICNNFIVFVKRLNRMQVVKKIDEFTKLNNKNGYLVAIEKLMIKELISFWDTYWQHLDTTNVNTKKALIDAFLKSINKITIS